MSVVSGTQPVSLAATLREYIAACFPGLWITSHEHDEAVSEIAQLCRAEAWRLAVWDLARGLHLPLEPAGAPPPAADPLTVLQALPGLAVPESSTLLVLLNYHRFLQSPEIIQTLARQIGLGKQQRTFVLIVAPQVLLPPELDKQFVIVEHPLPDDAQLAAIAQGVATEPGEFPADETEQARLLAAARGLTRSEAEGAFALSLVRHGRLVPSTLWELKTQTLKKKHLLTLHRGNETFADLGGLAALKGFCRQALRPLRSSPAKPRGILLLGVPGTGKSAFAKALGNELGRPTLLLEMGSLLGSLVGQSEQQLRQALQLADAMAPCILFVDELEKALSGAASSGQTDSGVTARLFGALLTWLSDHASEVFFVGTCNDVRKLPPEFARAERFDGVFFLDLPGAQQQEAIWELCRAQFAIDPDQEQPAAHDWTGAEIRACCRLAALLDLPLTAAAEQVVPVAATAREQVEELRRWAGPAAAASSPRRKLPRDPQWN